MLIKFFTPETEIQSWSLKTDCSPPMILKDK